MKRFSFLLASIFLILNCGGPSLPESYGFYAVDGRKLVRFGESETPEKFGPGVKFILFDKILASGLIGQGAVPLEEIAKVQHAAFVRFEVERIKDRRSNGLKELHIIPSGQITPLESNVSVNYSPIKNEPEMLEIAPSERLPRGLYSLRFDSKIFYLLRQYRRGKNQR